MYLPKSKYSSPKYTRGNEFILESGKAYTGWYFKTYKGEAFTGKIPSKTSDILISIDDDDSNVQTLRFKDDIIRPTQSDYDQGYITRYFVQDKRNKVIVEVNKKNYLEFGKLSYTTTYSLDWNLTSPAEDVKKGPYIYFGSANKNRELSLKAEETMPGFIDKIKSFSKFVK